MADPNNPLLSEEEDALLDAVWDSIDFEDTPPAETEPPTPAE